MLKLFKEIRKAGNATVQYPFAPLETSPGTRGKPEHDEMRCIACGACAVACPPDAISMQPDLAAGTTTWGINYGRCIFCGRCEEACPVEAIKLSQEFELAVMSKADLEETCAYELARCAACGKYFAPRKEVDYAKRLLAHAGGPEAAEASDSADICLECKRKADAQHAARHYEAEKKGGVR